MSFCLEPICITCLAEQFSELGFLSFRVTGDLQAVVSIPEFTMMKSHLLQPVQLSRSLPFLQLRDPANKRYEVPLETPKARGQIASKLYSVQFSADPFGLMVFRESSGQVL